MKNQESAKIWAQYWYKKIDERDTHLIAMAAMRWFIYAYNPKEGFYMSGPNGEGGGGGSGSGSGGSTSVLTRPGSKTKRKYKTKSKTKSGVQTKSKAKGLSKFTKAGAKILTKRNLARAGMGLAILGTGWTLANMFYRVIKGEPWGMARNKALGIGEIEVS